MPAATFDYDLATGKATLLQQDQPGLQSSVLESSAPSKPAEWLDLSSLYVCKQVMATSLDGVHVPLTVVHSSNLGREGTAPALLVGYGAYGQMLETEWCSDRLTLLDRGWVLAFAHVRWVLSIQFTFNSGLRFFPALVLCFDQVLLHVFLDNF